MLLGMRNHGLMSLKLISELLKNFGFVEVKVVIPAEAEISEVEHGVER